MLEKKFTCYLIGQGSLLIRCAEYILDQKNTILGIASADPKILSWAKSKGIHTYNNPASLEKEPIDKSFDYLFSIHNPFILSSKALALSKILSINYHDSLLPKYAGLNATAWAIFNNEKTHGITWHVMERKIDSGSILKQKTVMIDETETTGTLNLKCYEAGFKAFVELVDEIRTDSICFIPQNLENRTLFTAQNKIPNDGIIDWCQDAELIDRQIRALSFGNYENILPTPKLLLSNTIYTIKKHKINVESNTFASDNISLIDDSILQITTATYPILIMELQTNSGEMISINEVAEKHNISNKQVPKEWHSQKKDFELIRIEQAFKYHVKNHGNSIAIRYGDISLTYQELYEKAVIVAKVLIRNGLKKGDFVPILFEKSPDMIIAMLGILLAGCAYCPIDKSSSIERLHFILKQLDANLVLSNADLKGDFVNLKIENLQLKDENIDLPLDNNLNINDPMYVLFTSGTTGTPKGVVVGHKSIFNLLLTFNQHHPLQIGDNGTLWTNFTFDVSVYEIFSCLCFGGTLHIYPETTTIDSNKFFKQLIVDKIVSCYIPPFFFDEFAEFVEHSNQMLVLKRLLVGVEPIKTTSAKIIYDNLKDIQIINGYGPTEASICSTYCLFNPEPCGNPYLPIGKPVANTEVYVLDDSLQPVPIGVEGLLFVGGKCLSLGYLNETDIKKNGWIKNNFTSNKNEYLYNTGDVVKWLPDGNLFFICRKDRQVKLNGIRINLTGIEKLIRRVSCVTSCAVILKDSAILAFYTKSETAHQDISIQINKKLKEHLPTSHIPRSLILLDSMPLTKNGKIDYSKIKAEKKSHEANNNATKTELTLLSLWQELLGTQFSINDNFFEMGGDSLVAVRFIAKVKEVFKVVLPIETIFKYPTIQELSRIIADADAEAHQIFTNKEMTVGDIPLSTFQNGIWFLCQMAPESSVYNIPYVMEFQGCLNITLFEKALKKLISRHDSLRTNFIVKDGKPCQIINKNKDIDFQHLNLNVTPNDLIQSFLCQKFNLERDALIRFRLYEMSKNRYLFAISVHHIICDEWSMSLMIREIENFYNQTHSEIDFMQYSDFSRFQKNYLPNNMQPHIDYWLDRLSGCELTTLTDETCNKPLTDQGERFYFEIDEELSNKLNEFGSRHQLTLNMLMLSIFSILLAKYTNKEDIIIGTPMANRKFPEIANTIGFFINTLPMKCIVQDQQLITDYLHQMRNDIIESYQHQELPLHLLVKELNGQRSHPASSLFNIMCVVSQANHSILNLNDIETTPFEYDTKTAKFDLTLFVQEEKGILRCCFEYKTSAFSPKFIKRLSKHFNTLSNNLVDSKNLTIADLSLLSESDRQAFIQHCRSSKRPVFEFSNTYDYFESFALKNPETVAIVGKFSLTYRELLLQVDFIASLLHEKGLSGSKVAICLKKSELFVAATLAILKVGSTYIPLGDSLPVERLSYILQDSGAKAAIVSDGSDSFNIQLLNPLHDYTNEDLAYIIYTSGSTGNPKGINLPHKTLINLIEWQKQYLDKKIIHKIGLFSNVIFDVATQSIFLALMIGNTLVIIPDEVKLNYYELLKLIESTKITILFMTPSFLNGLASCHEEVTLELNSLHQIIVAGESLVITEAIRQLFKKIPHCELINQYGPAESHVVTSHSLGRGEVADSWPILPPIGMPISNAMVILLDKNLKPVPKGVCGEIFISGCMLAKGYLNQADNAKFLLNPYASNPEFKQMYQSGDIGISLEDGNIQFIGRNDHLVKINGARVEISEIEAVLKESDLIEDAAVTARYDQNQKAFLVAYLVNKKGTDTNYSILKKTLENKLPLYMIPQSAVFLSKIPMTETGKINRKILMQQPLENDKNPFQLPRNETEVIVAEIWKKILSIKNVSIYDNFFQMGGDSLLSAQLLFKVSKEFDKSIPFEKFYTSPTIKTLSDIILGIKNSQSNLWVEDLKLNSIHIEDSLPNLNLPHAILLTGCTGFVGLHLLNTLIKKTSAKIYCLMRASDNDSALRQMKQEFNRYRLDFDNIENRMIPILGTLDEENFGLCKDLYHELTRKVDIIYHSAAYVHHLYGYESLRKTNVLGTHEIIKFAVINKIKPVHYISTLAAAIDRDSDDYHQEDFPRSSTVDSENGYIVTKWVSESILRNANELGLPCVIYRLPFITGSASAGIAPLDKNHLFLFIKACSQLGYAPKDWGKLDFMPVDLIVNFIADVSLFENQRSQVFNMSNKFSCPWEEFFGYMNGRDHRISLIDNNDWINNHLALVNETNALYPLLPLYLGGLMTSDRRQKKIRFDNTSYILNKYGYSYPKMDECLFETYYNNMVGML